MVALLLAGCGEPPWNNPYPSQDTSRSIFFSSFSERPKYLDPARSYSSNEWAFISQIYEPPLQYHYLKRPYTLVPLTATSMPEIRRYDRQGNPLPEDATPEQIASTEYRLHIQPGIRYQPHPAFARKPDGSYRYWPLSEDDLEDRYTLQDFPETGSRPPAGGRTNVAEMTGVVRPILLKETTDVKAMIGEGMNRKDHFDNLYITPDIPMRKNDGNAALP